MEAARHPAHDRDLLRVLLAEVGAGRADEVEELATDCCNPAEVPRPGGALEAARELLDVDPGLVARRVELLDRGREEDVGAGLSGDARVPLLVPWVRSEVVAGVELGGVDEQAHDEEVVLVPRGAKQREVGRDAVQRDEVVGGDGGARVVEGPSLLGELERLEAEQAGKLEAELPRLGGLGRHRGPGTVELLRAARPRERLQRMEAEAPLVRRERGERRRAADVRDPGAGLDPGGRVCNRRVGDAERDELAAVLAQLDAALREPRRDRRPDASRADHLHRLDHRKLQFRSGYRAGEAYRRAVSLRSPLPSGRIRKRSVVRSPVARANAIHLPFGDQLGALSPLVPAVSRTALPPGRAMYRARPELA